MTTFGLVLAAAVVAVALASPAAARASDDGVRGDLARLAQRSVWFAHQSVGGDLLEGIRELAAPYPELPLRIVETADPGAIGAGTLAHARVGENGDPGLKLADFARHVDAGIGDRADVVLVKLCYVDFDARTDVAALFERYRRTIEGLRARHPRATFVHVTTPLTTVQRGPKAVAKRLLGRAPGGADENARRATYNELMRRAYAGQEPLFDLAREEATGPDGREQSFTTGGRTWPALVPAYTADGGHLLPDARRRIARHLIAVIAALP